MFGTSSLIVAKELTLKLNGKLNLSDAAHPSESPCLYVVAVAAVRSGPKTQQADIFHRF